MGTHQDTSTLNALADAVSETVEAENAKAAAGSGSGPIGKGARVSSTSTEGLDVKTAFDGGGAEVGTTRVVHTETREETIAGCESKVYGCYLGVAGEGDNKCGYPNGEDSSRENGEGPDKKLGEINGSSEAQLGNGGGGGGGKIGNLNPGGRVDTMVVDEGNEVSDDVEVEYMEDHTYSVGDLVWGKIRSHPWWPGQIYDPSDASEPAIKLNQRGRLLVAYFGDGSFAWCSPSQLIPFAEHFEDMAIQSSSRTFVKAVQEAVDEIGRLVELELTCSCVPEANRNGLNRPLADNAGIREGALVPNGNIGKLLSFRYTTAELLTAVKNAAVSVSFSGMIELAILKSSLSALYRARGGFKLAVCEPLQIEGLGTENQNKNVEANDFSIPIEVPIHRPLEEDWPYSATSGPGNGQQSQDDKSQHRRKQKSVAELMAEDTGAKPKGRKRGSSGEGKNAGDSIIKRQKFSEEVQNHSGGVEAASGRKRGRKKKDDIPQSGEAAASDAVDGSQTEAQREKGSSSSKVGKALVVVTDSNDDESMKGSEEMTSPRERKKSKYLSPPYTTPHFRVGLSSKKEELEGETANITRSKDKMGDRMSRAAEKLLVPPPGGSETRLETSLRKGRSKLGTNLNSRSGTGDLERSIDTRKISVSSVNEVLSGIRSLAVNPQHSWKGSLLDLVGGFILTFRSLMHFDGANYKDDLKRYLEGKRKSLNSKPAKLGKDLSQTGEKPLTARTGGKKRIQEKLDTGSPKEKTSNKKSIQEKLNTSKSKKAAVGSGQKAQNEEVDGRSAPASLIVTFGPGMSLPSKDDIIRIYTKFGDLNEQETDVLPDFSTARICFTRRSAAGDAMKTSLREKPFGSGNVKFKLSYQDRRAVAAHSAADGTSDLASMSKKLQLMTSMLGKCEGKISTDNRSSLHGDIEALFEKIKKIADDASG